MSLIVAGRFTTFPAAEAAAQRLFTNGFVEEDVTLFFVNPRGQHARYPIGGDQDVDPGARDTPKGAGKGVTIGAVVGAIVGAGLFTVFHAPLLVSVIAAGVGAYIGSLIGAMSHTREGNKHGHQSHHEERDSGVLLAAGRVMAPMILPADLLTLFGFCVTGYVMNRTAEKVAAMPGESNVNLLGVIRAGNKS